MSSEISSRAAHPAAGASDDVFWQAVLDRDPRFDGVVYYAVRTTGVFCRPVCPSRRPLLENVAFFNAPEEARSSGFRPCKRCRPESCEGHSEERKLLIAACRAIESAAEGSPTLSALADRLGVSPDRTRRMFQRLLGVSHKQYGDAVKVARFKRSVGAGESVASAIYAAGFGSSSRLYENAGARLGMTPATYRRCGQGEDLYFWAWGCALGTVLVAATEKGVCSVKLGGSQAELEQELRSEFRNARVRAGANEPGSSVQALRDYLAGQAALPADLPSDVVGTAFQARVWAALREIPSGETRTYSEIADAIGQPRAVRAVASACARNPVALVVPCHRVVPKGAGTPGRYRWGEARKEKLLELERELRPIGDGAGDGVGDGDGER